MRLEKVRKGQGLGRILFPLMRFKIGARVPDVVRTIFYRPEFFGHGYNGWIQAVLRGPSAWSVWERELFAAFTSSRNQCVF
jgi:hypothetical protein